MSDVVRFDMALPRRLASLLDDAVERERMRTGVKLPRHEMVEFALWRYFAGRGA